jgi:hypothetical protein
LVPGVTAALLLAGVAVAAAFGGFGLVSLGEGEPRAAAIGFCVGLLGALCFGATTLLPITAQVVVLGTVGLVVTASLVLFLLPIGKMERGDEVPQSRFDERDIMFARAHLVPGSPDHDAYYAMRPENKHGDDKTRSLPGLLSPGSVEFHALAFAATDAGFFLTEALRDAVDGPVGSALAVSIGASGADAEKLTAFAKDLALYYGARTVGVTSLEPYHVYTHIGRGSGKYGAQVTLTHRFAIAFTVEMDYRMVGTAPRAPTVMESAHQYVEAAKVAVQLAAFIRRLGFPARAHIDGNYRVIAPLVARDARLGEIGRMGLLMTPELGPRVRLGVVTTEMPMVVNRGDRDLSVLDFCRVCEKCADCCPPQAIPHGGREEIDGALRWRIDDEICFRYWNAVGTDCARCVAVCPYSHADNLTHDLVRWAVRRSGAARRVAVWLDDLFYGASPKAKPWADWLLDEPQHR